MQQLLSSEFQGIYRYFLIINILPHTLFLNNQEINNWVTILLGLENKLFL